MGSIKVIKIFGIALALSTLFIARAEAMPFKASFDCAKASSEVEKTICLSKALADADAELGLLYKNLISALPETEKDQLRKEQIEWLATRDRSCGSPEINAACLKDLYSRRIDTLRKWKLSKSEPARRVVSDAVNAALKTTTSVSNQTIILSKSGRDLNIGLYHYLDEYAQLYSSKILTETVKDQNIYLVLDACAYSRPGKAGGNCGAGTECFLVWVELGSGFEKRGSWPVLYNSCLLSREGNYDIYKNRLIATFQTFPEMSETTLSFDSGNPENGFLIQAKKFKVDKR